MDEFIIADFSGLEKWKIYMKQESVKDVWIDEGDDALYELLEQQKED